MLTESQIDYCLAKIREQLTPIEGMAYKPNIDAIVGVLKQTIEEAYKTDKATYDQDSVFQIGLDERTACILDHNGYLTVLALRSATPRELLEVRQLGPVAIQKVRECLSERGIKMRGDLSKHELRVLCERHRREEQIKRDGKKRNAV